MVNPFNKANSFDLSHEHLLTCNMGKLIPVELLEVVPGDTLRQRTNLWLRMEAMIAPILSRCDVRFHSFYVPNRTIMNDWESYITGGFDGDDTTVKPFMVAPEGGYKVGSLADYLGLPTGVAGYKHSALPFRAYAKIYNEWFRDENLIDELPLSLESGEDKTTSTDLLAPCWEKDYFTNALPTPQRGPAANLPLGISAPVAVYGNGNALGLENGTDEYGLTFGTTNSYALRLSNGVTTPVGQPVQEYDGPVNVAYGMKADPARSGVIGTADLRQATAVSVNDVRLAFQIQKFMEKNMRGGARLVEWTQSHFGVRIPDGRLQRAEYLGGSRSPIMIAPVEQTSSTDATSPQGNLAGRGTSVSSSLSWTKSFVEQGWVITLMSILPRTAYSQGLHRMWSRESRYEEYVPVFAHLGEQDVRNKEIFVQGNEQDDGIFGYNDRFAELRRIPSSIHGQFRSGQTLDYWTMGRQFDSLPQLNAEFVTADPTRRIFAVTDESVDTIECQVLHNIKAIRPLPKYGSPGLIDHD